MLTTVLTYRGSAPQAKVFVDVATASLNRCEFPSDIVGCGLAPQLLSHQQPARKFPHISTTTGISVIVFTPHGGRLASTFLGSTWDGGFYGLQEKRHARRLGYSTSGYGSRSIVSTRIADERDTSSATSFSPKEVCRARFSSHRAWPFRPPSSAGTGPS